MRHLGRIRTCGVVAAAVLALAAAACGSGTDPRATGSTGPSQVPTPSSSVVPSVSVLPSEIPTVDSTTGATTDSTTGSTTSGPAGQTVIPLSGTEAYGLAATSDSVWAVLYQDEVLSRVDPETNREVDAIDAGQGAATLLTVGEDVWLARYGGPGPSDPDVTIYRDGEPVADVEAGELCCDLTLLDDTVWGLDPAGRLVGIDARGGAVVGRIRVPLHFDIHTNVVAGGDHLWASSDDTPLYRVDPDSGTIVGEVKTGGGVPFLEHDGLVWGATPDELWAVDASTGEVVRRIPLEDSIEVISMAVDDDAIWLGMRHIGAVGAVERLDPTTGDVLADLPVDIPARIVLAFGSAWVTDSGSGNLYRFEPDAV